MFVSEVKCECKPGYIGDGFSCTGNLLQVLESTPTFSNFLTVSLMFDTNQMFSWDHSEKVQLLLLPWNVQCVFLIIFSYYKYIFTFYFFCSKSWTSLRRLSQGSSLWSVSVTWRSSQRCLYLTTMACLTTRWDLRTGTTPLPVNQFSPVLTFPCVPADSVSAWHRVPPVGGSGASSQPAEERQSDQNSCRQSEHPRRRWSARPLSSGQIYLCYSH